MLALTKKILAFGLLNLYVFALSAQIIATDQVIDPALVFTTKNGLPQIQTTSMLQDSRGYIWAGSKRGLAKYNGSKWETVVDDLNFALLGETSNGNIAAVILQSGLGPYYIYDGVKMNASTAKLFDPNKFNCHLVNDTLFHINVLDGKMYQYDLKLDKLIGEKKLEISKYKIAGYSEKHGLILQQRTNDGQLNFLKLEDLKIIAHTQVVNEHLIPLKVGTDLYTNFKNGYLEYYDFNNFELLGRVKYDNNQIKDAEFYSEENFYFSDADNNYKYNANNNKIEVFKQISSTNNIFLEDRDGNLWNSSESGIQLFPKNNFIDYNQRALGDAWFFQAYNDAYIYGNFSGGLKRVQLNPYRVQQIKSNKVNRIYFGPSLMNSKLYIPGSAYISVLEGNNLGHIDIRSYNTPVLSSFYDVLTKAIYFGGLKSLIKLDSNEAMSLYNDDKEVFSRYVLTINRFDDQHLIFGTSTDLCLFNTQTLSFESISSLFPSKDKAGAICLEKDNRGNFWIGNNIGLWFYNVEKNSLLRISEKNIDDNVMSLKQVKDNLLAIGTSNNLMYLELDEFYGLGKQHLKAFNFMNGFHGEEVAQNGMTLQDSILWIPSATNLVSTNVNAVEFSPAFSNVIINSINNNKLKFGLEDGIVDMTYGIKDLEIEFEAIGINQPRNSSYQYKLIGLEDEWSPWTTDTKANFRDLPSGEYEFVVRTRANSALGESFPEKNVMIRLDMPFYSEPHFHSNALYLLLLMLGLIGVLLYTIYNRRLSKLELDKRFKLLQVQTLQLQLNPHFLFNVLGTIQSLILEKDIDNANKYLVSFSKMIRRYLDYNVSAYKSLEANSKDTIKISLSEEFDILKIYLEFEKLQLDDKFDYEIKIDNDIDPKEIQIPPLIIQPLLENCIKHGVVPKKGKSFIQLNATRKGTGILIYIKDDGIGISRSLELQKSSMKEFKSLSLRLINERIDVLNSMGESISLEIIDLPDEEGVEQLIFIDQIQNEA